VSACDPDLLERASRDALRALWRAMDAQVLQAARDGYRGVIFGWLVFREEDGRTLAGVATSRLQPDREQGGHVAAVDLSQLPAEAWAELRILASRPAG
jgi:hypothetical protein